MVKNCKNCRFKLMVELVKPTAEQASEYAKFLGWDNFDAQYFLATHERVGWVTDKGLPIRDWKAEVRIWMIWAFKRGEIKPSGGKTFKEKYDENRG